jgi:hypothetical protein
VYPRSAECKLGDFPTRRGVRRSEHPVCGGQNFSPAV